MTTSNLSPAEVVDRYTELIYHQRDLSALDDLISDPLIRHEPDGTRVALTTTQARERIATFHKEFRAMRFSNRKIVQDSNSVAAAYEADLVDESGAITTICGIEIFTVVEGRIIEVWTAPAGSGSWG